MKSWQFLNYLNDYHVPKKGSLPWS